MKLIQQSTDLRQERSTLNNNIKNLESIREVDVPIIKDVKGEKHIFLNRKGN